MPEPNSGCILWTGDCTNAGYGRLTVGYRGKRTLAHRYAYERVNGPVPDGLQLDHLCRTRCCVNVAHLEPVTQRENILRGVSPAARHAKKAKCEHGHAFTRANTYRTARGTRVCRKCHLLADLAKRIEDWESGKIPARGRSGFRGVGWHAQSGKWRATCTVPNPSRKGRGVCYSLGLYATPEEAAAAYDEFAAKHHGHRARLNFPEAK
jgi:hypothetical protein